MTILVVETPADVSCLRDRFLGISCLKILYDFLFMFSLHFSICELNNDHRFVNVTVTIVKRKRTHRRTYLMSKEELQEPRQLASAHVFSHFINFEWLLYSFSPEPSHDIGFVLLSMSIRIPTNWKIYRFPQFTQLKNYRSISKYDTQIKQDLCR